MRRSAFANLNMLVKQEAIVADRFEVAARSSDEILSGQSNGVDVVAFAAPISTMHYAVISAPGLCG